MESASKMMPELLKGLSPQEEDKNICTVQIKGSPDFILKLMGVRND